MFNDTLWRGILPTYAINSRKKWESIKRKIIPKKKKKMRNKVMR